MQATSQISTSALLTRRGVGRAGIPAGEAARLDLSFLASTLLLNVLGLLLPIATLHVFDRVLPNSAYETLLFMVAGLLVAALAEFVLRRLQVRVSAMAATRYAADLRRAALSHLLGQPRDAENSAPSSVSLERLSAIDRFTSFYSGGARAALIDLPFACLALGLIWILGGLIVLAPLSVIVLHFVVLGVLSRAIRARILIRRQEDVKSSDFLSETFRSSTTVKSWAIERLVLRRYERLLGAAAKNHFQTLLLNDAVKRQSGLLANLVTVATLAAGGAMAIAGEATIGVVAACTLLAARAAQPALRAAKAWGDVQRAVLSAEEVANLFKGESAAARPHSEVQKTLAAPTLRLQSTAPVIPAGSILALQGRNADARTMLLEMIVGLRGLSEEGEFKELRVDDLAPVDFRASRPGAVALVSRSPQPMSGAILENLTMFGRGASETAAHKVAERIKLSESVQKLTKGYDTILGASSNDVLPPEGQVKLAFARAVALGAKLIALDEPSAHLTVRDVSLLRAEILNLVPDVTFVIATSDTELLNIATHSLSIGARAPDLALKDA